MTDPAGSRGRPDAPPPAQRPSPVRPRGRGRPPPGKGTRRGGRAAAPPARRAGDRRHRRRAGRRGLRARTRAGRGAGDPDPRDPRQPRRPRPAGEDVRRAWARNGAPVHVLAYVGALRLVGCDTTLPGSPVRGPRPRSAEVAGRALSDEHARPDAAGAPPPSGRRRDRGDGRDRARPGGRRGPRVAARGPPPGAGPHLRPRPPHGGDDVRGTSAADLPQHELDPRLDLRPEEGLPAGSTSSRWASPCTSSRTAARPLRPGARRALTRPRAPPSTVDSRRQGLDSARAVRGKPSPAGTGRRCRRRRSRASTADGRRCAGRGRGARACSRRAPRPGRWSKPVPITVTRTSSDIDSSITAPKMMLAFGSAAFWMISAASLTSNRPRSLPPVMFSRMPVAPSTFSSSSGEEIAALAASAVGSRRRRFRSPSAPSRRPA